MHNIGPWEIVNLVLILPGIILYLIIYFLPSIISYWQSKSAIKKIFIVNLLLGWTVIGWIVSFVWAISENQSQECQNTVETNEPFEWENVIKVAKSKGITPQMAKTFIDKINQN
jgi:hypothetical protein